MTHKHLFILDPLTELNRELDTSLRTMAALARRGHRVFAAEQTGLYWNKSDGSAGAKFQELQFEKGLVDFRTGEMGHDSLSWFDAIHQRKDPPFDMEYIATTWLLDTATRSSKVYNHPNSLRTYSEKGAIFLYPEDIDAALLASDPQRMLTFIREECAGNAILKPLTLFGGRGVLRISLTDRLSETSAIATLEKETKNGRVMRLVQPFDDAVYQGEVRAFTAFGTAVAWCLKKPQPGNFLANTGAGATLHDYSPEVKEVAMVERIARDLAKAGIAFIGFDLIGGKLSEINVTSPRLLLAEDRIEPFDRLASLIEVDIRGS